MFNAIEAYEQSGIRAARAMNDRDTARHTEERHYFNRMLAYEKGEDRTAARLAFDAGYKSARQVPKVEYFR